MSEVPYTVIFEWAGMPSHGAGPVATVMMVDGVLPPMLEDPWEQDMRSQMKGKWRLTGVSQTEPIAYYERVEE